MRRDLREDPLYREVLEHFRRIHEPNAGSIGDALDVRVSHDGRYIAVGGSVYEPLSGPPHQRIAIHDTSDRAIGLISNEANDATPRWAPQTNQLAFLSDRAGAGVMRLHFYDPVSAVVSLPAEKPSEGVESIAWSPNGNCILLQSVAPGADRAGALGSGTVAAEDDLPAWMPRHEPAGAGGWRRLWIYARATGSLRGAGPRELTFWEAEWCGNDGVLAIVSDDPREGAWHGARLVYLSADGMRCETIYDPVEEIGVPIATASGRYAAIIEGCCSDRTVVAGQVIVFDKVDGWRPKRIEISADVTSLAVRQGNTFSFAGLRGYEVVAGEIDAAKGSGSIYIEANESWLRRYPGVAPLGDDAYVTVAHSYESAPKLVRLAPGKPATALHDFANEGTRYVNAIGGKVRRVRWTSRDGLEIQGYLAEPASAGPHPLILAVHGGPVWAFTNAWQMFLQVTPLLVSRGYAVLHPNPRGSSGRGQPFARMVRGDVGGEERHDLLGGVEMAVREGVADPGRLAIMGASHGGYMSAWMVSQTDLFAAAVAIAPVTDWLSAHYTAADPEFDRIFVGGDPQDVEGKYFSRSPIMFARAVKTPTLLIAGAKDRCTPPGQAIEFHQALVENGVESELAIYPREGHGVREFEALVDCATRTIRWLDAHLKVPAPAQARVFERSM